MDRFLYFYECVNVSEISIWSIRNEYLLSSEFKMNTRLLALFDGTKNTERLPVMNRMISLKPYSSKVGRIV